MKGPPPFAAAGSASCCRPQSDFEADAVDSLAEPLDPEPDPEDPEEPDDPEDPVSEDDEVESDFVPVPSADSFSSRARRRVP